MGCPKCRAGSKRLFTYNWTNVHELGMYVREMFCGRCGHEWEESYPNRIDIGDVQVRFHECLNRETI